MPHFFLEWLVFATVCIASEAVFTGLNDFWGRIYDRDSIDWELPCRTWLWSILVYGLSAAASFLLLGDLLPAFFETPWWVRGAVYTLGIFAWEFAWGWLLELLIDRCPWEYQIIGSPWERYIRLSYAPFWFLFGFLLEWTHLRLVPAVAALL